MMRGALALLAAGCCVALGGRAARRLEQREKLLNAWDGALMRMEGAVTHSGEGLKDVLRRGVGQGTEMLSALARDLQRTPAADPEALIAALPWDERMTEMERDTLRECLLSLFSPSLEQQARAIAYCREQWAVFRRKGRETRERDGRLYAGLGWLAGAAAFILLC